MKVFLRIVVLVGLVLTGAGHVSAAQEGDMIPRARELILHERYSAAITLLEQHIEKHPDDAEGYYLMGVSFIRSVKYAGAKKWFAKARAQDGSYSPMIGDRYIEAGKEALQKGSPGLAGILFNRALLFDASRHKSIAQHYFAVGRSYLNRYESRKADALFATALLYDGDLQENINCVTADYGRRLLVIAKEKPENEQKKYVDEALKYLGQKEGKEVLQ
jgi:tetratricopeptide (TPR) repeat protein